MKERYDHQKTVILPRTRYDWIHLRLQDFKSVSDYNSAVFKISYQLKLCGENISDEDMLEKTYTTFHASNMLLQQQYREHRFAKYSKLIACLLVVEQNNEFLLKNHQSYPTESISLPEANATIQTNRPGCGRGYFYEQGLMDEAEAVIVVTIFLGIKVIIINLTIRKTTPITRSCII